MERLCPPYVLSHPTIDTAGLIATTTTAIAQCLEHGPPTYLLRLAIDRGAGTGAVCRGDVAAGLPEYRGSIVHQK